MPVSADSRNSHSIPRSADTLENEEFAIYAIPAGFLAEDLKRNPWGWADLRFIDTQTRVVESGTEWTVRYLFTTEPGGARI